MLFCFMCGRIQLYYAYSTYPSNVNRSVGTHEFAASTNEGWDLIRFNAAFSVGTREIEPLYVSSFLFVVGIWCCAYYKEDLSTLMFPSTSATWTRLLGAHSKTSDPQCIQILHSVIKYRRVKNTADIWYLK